MEHDSLVADNLCLGIIRTAHNLLTAATWHVGFGLHITYEPKTMQRLSSEVFLYNVMHQHMCGARDLCLDFNTTALIQEMLLTGM